MHVCFGSYILSLVFLYCCDLVFFVSSCDISFLSECFGSCLVCIVFTMSYRIGFTDVVCGKTIVVCGGYMVVFGNLCLSWNMFLTCFSLCFL